MKAGRLRRNICAALVAIVAVIAVGTPQASRAQQADVVPERGFGALARVVAEDSGATERRGEAVEIRFRLTQGVPWRAYTLADPDRLVLDFQEVDWSGLSARQFQVEGISSVTFGAIREGWSRFVAELDGPFAVRSADLRLDDTRAGAWLVLALEPTTRGAFDAGTGAAPDAHWTLPQPSLRATPPRPPGRRLIMLDPGHGGIDPGAVRGELREADLVLRIARDIEEALLRSGEFDVLLTRTEDVFVSLERRIAMTREAGADVFISIHADALREGHAQGVTVYTLSETASDEASAALAERHDRAELLSGVDLSGSDDEVAQVLIDLARHDSGPRSEMLAQALIEGIRQVHGGIHKRPLRRAGFSVLKSPETPSVLIEAGFLTTDADLRNLLDPAWRADLARGVRDGLLAWSLADEAVAPLRRQ